MHSWLKHTKCSATCTKIDLLSPWGPSRGCVCMCVSVCLHEIKPERLKDLSLNPSRVFCLTENRYIQGYSVHWVHVFCEAHKTPSESDLHTHILLSCDLWLNGDWSLFHVSLCVTFTHRLAKCVPLSAPFPPTLHIPASCTQLVSWYCTLFGNFKRIHFKHVSI